MIKGGLATLIACALAVTFALPVHASARFVASYHMEETSGTVAHDSSGYGNDASIYHLELGQPGYVGWGFGFKGSPSLGYVRIPASSSINPGTHDFTYRVRINIPSGTSITHDYSLLRRGASKSPGPFYKLELVRRQNTGAVHAICAWRDDLGNHVSVQGGSDWNTGKWNKLACKRSGSTFSLRRNNKVLASKTVAGMGSFSSSNPIFLGAEQIDSTHFWELFHGTMDEVRLWKG
ncbi:MAG: LamG domain-containing protein [Actinomycetota bacterium]|nr:LamG domain-containing protein [Actinomycetota bacterium]